MTLEYHAHKFIKRHWKSGLNSLIPDFATSHIDHKQLAATIRKILHRHTEMSSKHVGCKK